MNDQDRPGSTIINDRGARREREQAGISDDDAFSQWYRSSFARLRRALTLTTGDAGLAEEATAEAFARALVHWRKLKDSPGRDKWCTGRR